MRKRFWVAMAVVAACAALAVVAVVAVGARRGTHPPAQFSLYMAPVPPLTAAARVSEARRYGFSASAGAIICAPGARYVWYQATLANRGPYGLPACAATGFDAHGKPVFTGRLFFDIGGIRGLFVPGHGSITFYWYLPRKTRVPVSRFTATCSPVHGPPNV